MRGIGLMVLAMAFLSTGDMFVKFAAQDMPAGQVLAALSLGGTLVFAALALAQGVAIRDPRMLHPAMAWRNVTEAVGAIGMVLGVALVPLATFAAVIQMAPLIVTVTAALLLKEPIGPRRWSAIAAGLVGMLMVLRPWQDDFTLAALLPLMGITALGIRDVLTRLAPPGLSTLTMSVWGFAATIPAGPFLMALMGTPFDPGPGGLIPVILATLTFVTGYYAINSAMRMAPAAIVAPFRYTRLIFVMGLAVFVFGERPDGWTLAGAAIILAAGLYTFLRERQLARAPAA